MADRYQGRPFRADDNYDRSQNPTAQPHSETDPLAELARLIGQTDPFSNFGGHGREAPAHGAGQETDTYDQAQHFDINPGPPSWMQRVAQREAAPAHYDEQVPADDAAYYVEQHAPAPRVQGYAPSRREAAYAQPNEQQLDPARYDDALYDVGEDAQNFEPSYPQDPYGQEYDDELAEPPRRRGGMASVVVVLALAFIGTAAAYGYRTYTGSPRSGEAPIIRADAGPNKIVPPSQNADGAGKPIQDRLAAGPGSERIVSREEQPVDVNAAASAAPSSAPSRSVFPPVGQTSGTVPSPPPALRPSTSGNFAGDEPRKIRTLSIRPDQTDTVPAAPVTRPAVASPPAPAVRAVIPPVAAVPAANAPVSLIPQTQAEPPVRTASTSATIASGAGSTGGYVVQVSSRKSEADAQASYRVLQSKFSDVLASRPSLIKRADLGEKGIYYRAMVGPFDSSDEASQLCSNLKSAGGQCVVQRN
jgi:hypothetical protein